MQKFKLNFSAEQSGAHPKGVQVTHLTIFGSLLGSVGLSLAFSQLVYIDPKVCSHGALVRHSSSTLKDTTCTILAL